jgi:hypothetical protein
MRSVIECVVANEHGAPRSFGYRLRPCSEQISGRSHSHSERDPLQELEIELMVSQAQPKTSAYSSRKDGEYI